MPKISHHRIAGYTLPNVQDHADDARRLVGLDVPDLTDRELYAEGERAGGALAEAIASDSRVWIEWSDPPYAISAVAWLERRLRLVQAEVRKRKGSRR